MKKKHYLCRAKCAAGPPSSLTHKAQSFQTQTTMKHILKAIPVGVLSALAVLLVAYFSLDADPLGDTNLMLFPGSDKVGHFLLYLGTAMVFILDYAKFKLPHHTKLNMELMYTCCAMVLGLIMEVGQLVLSNGRTYDMLDVVANCLGAATGFGYMRLWGLHRFRRTMLHSGHHHHRHRRHRS